MHPSLAEIAGAEHRRELLRIAEIQHRAAAVRAACTACRRGLTDRVRAAVRAVRHARTRAHCTT